MDTTKSQKSSSSNNNNGGSSSSRTRQRKCRQNGARLMHQRNLANLRERRRMVLINKGFDLLRSKLPIVQRQFINNQGRSRPATSENEPRKRMAQERRQCRLTKVDILRLTVDYIKQLTRMLNEPMGQQSIGDGDVGDSMKNDGSPIIASPTILAHKSQQEAKRRYRARQQAVARKISEEICDKLINRQLIVQWGSSVGSRYLLSWNSFDDTMETPNKGSSKLWIPQTDMTEGETLNSSNSEDVSTKIEEAPTTFQALGIDERLCEVCKSLNWNEPTKIQREAIPIALQGRDVIGLAETGSGKTAAFILPILQSLLENPRRLFALVLTPTRELAIQIQEQVAALGAGFQIKSAVLVGGMDMMTQAVALAKKPHIIIATPGRLVDHLEKTKGFNLSALKYLVLDEADRILNMDFEKEIDKVLEQIPRERRTFLFSATMTKKVVKLQRASLKDPVRIEVSTKFQTVDHLKQHYLFIPAKYKEVYLVHILNELSGNSFIVFCNTCPGTQKIALMLRNLGFSAIPINGKMIQAKRLAALNKFKVKSSSVLLATDVASRGLDIPHVDVVINFDLPQHSKDYIHRVGRTARAGRYGKAITFVTQYDVEMYQKIEHLLGQKLPLYETVEQEVMILGERVREAERLARIEQHEMDERGSKRKKGSDDDDDDDDDNEDKQDGRTVRKFKKKFKKNNNNKGAGGKVKKFHKKPSAFKKRG